jgi:hypothetical protein
VQLKIDPHNHTLSGYNQLLDNEIIQVRKPPEDRAAKVYFTFHGVVFDTTHFTNDLDGMWQHDGVAMAIQYVGKYVVKVAVMTKEVPA